MHLLHVVPSTVRQDKSWPQTGTDRQVSSGRRKFRGAETEMVLKRQQNRTMYASLGEMARTKQMGDVDEEESGTAWR